MATTYKTLTSNDIISTKTLLHEAIPITGTIVSGSYNDGQVEQNIKNYTHGMFQSVYDYPYLSSSANHIFDISIGLAPSSSDGGAASELAVDPGTSAARVGVTQLTKKTNIYNQMAQVLMGYASDGTIRVFDVDGNLGSGDKLKEVYFINFSRLLSKDEIKKGSFSLELGVKTNHGATGFNRCIKLIDHSASLSPPTYLVNSPAGEYGILYATSSVVETHPNIHGETLGNAATMPKAGLIFYQAGIAVITGSIFEAYDNAAPSPHTDVSLNTANSTHMANCDMSASGGTQTVRDQFVSGALSASCNGIRQRIKNIAFNNTTELNSTVYFCRAHHNEFNYSTNPTYLSDSQIVVKNNASDSPVSYITTVGLYSSDNELLATAKLSEPLKKDPSNELTLRVRLDY